MTTYIPSRASRIATKKSRLTRAVYKSAYMYNASSRASLTPAVDESSKSRSLTKCYLGKTAVAPRYTPFTTTSPKSPKRASSGVAMKGGGKTPPREMGRHSDIYWGRGGRGGCLIQVH